MNSRFCKILSSVICFFVICTSHSMDLQLYKSDTSKAMLTARLFFYNLPVMSPEKACLRYNKFDQKVKEKISHLVTMNKNEILKNYITLISSIPPDVLELFFGYLVENVIPIATKADIYKKMVACQLYSSIADNQRNQLEIKITQLFPHHTCPERLTADNLKLLQIFFKEFSEDSGNREKLKDRSMNYNYKVACNLQGFKILLKSAFFKDNYYFYLPLYIPIIMTLTSWLACQGIKTHFYSDLMANLSDPYIQGEKIRVFNQKAQEYNSWLTSNQRHFDILQLKYIPKKILNFDQVKIPFIADLIIHSPLLLQAMKGAVSLLFSNRFPIVLCSFFCALFPMVTFLLTDEYPSYLVNNTHLASHLIKSIIIITALYGIYFYRSVSSYFNEKRKDSVVCNEEEITKLLARTDIQIVD